MFDGKCPYDIKKLQYLIWSFHLCKQVSMESGCLWLIRQLWNLFQNLLIPLTGMGNGFRENGKLWTFAKISNLNKTQVLMLSLGNNFVLLAPAKKVKDISPFIPTGLMNDKLKWAEHAPCKEELPETDFWSNSLRIFSDMVKLEIVHLEEK